MKMLDTRRVVGLAVASLLCVVPAQRSMGADPPAKGPSAEEKRLAGVETIENYYAELYAKPFRIEKDARLAHLVAIISLSRIDGPALTKRLMTPLAIAKVDPMVAQVAWEALHARATSLTPEQQRAWLDAGLKATEFGAFPGATAASLIGALATQPVDPKQVKALARFLAQVAEENDPGTPYGKETLDAAAKAVVGWGNPGLVSAIAGEMNAKAGRNGRLAALLAGLPNAPAEATPIAWGGWKGAGLKPNLPKLVSGSPFFPAPEKVVDPHDSKWVKESEIGDLRVNTMDLVFCVDGTGSMQASNEFVTAYVRSVSMALGTISQSTRVGAVYYRHENDPAVMLDCCRTAAKYALKHKDMTVQPLNLRGDPDDLVKSMRAMLPKEGVRISGHGGNGAYYSALETAAKMLGSPKKGTSLVIACIGDARMTPGSEGKIVELCKGLKEKGYICVFLNRDRWSAENLTDASKAASGEAPIVYRNDVNKLKDGGDVYDTFGASAFGQMCERAIRGLIPGQYGNRAQPLMSTAWTIVVAKERARVARLRLQ